MFSQSSTLEQRSPYTRHDVAKQSRTIAPIDMQPLIPENAFLHERQPLSDNVTEIVDAAARNLEKHLLPTRLKCSCDLTRHHREKHNRSSRHIFLT